MSYRKSLNEFYDLAETGSHVYEVGSFSGAKVTIVEFSSVYLIVKLEDGKKILIASDLPQYHGLDYYILDGDRVVDGKKER